MGNSQNLKPHSSELGCGEVIGSNESMKCTTLPNKKLEISISLHAPQSLKPQTSELGCGELSGSNESMKCTTLPNKNMDISVPSAIPNIIHGHVENRIVEKTTDEGMSTASLDTKQNELKEVKPTQSNIVSHNYPINPGAEDCFYYMKFKTCKYGSKCKFNHPIAEDNYNFRLQEVIGDNEQIKSIPSSEEEMDISVQSATPYTPQELPDNGIKEKVADESMTAMGVDTSQNEIKNEPTESNILCHSYPIRPGAKVCFYYTKFRTCKYGSKCKFNHSITEENHKLTSQTSGPIQPIITSNKVNAGFGSPSSSNYIEQMQESANEEQLMATNMNHCHESDNKMNEMLNDSSNVNSLSKYPIRPGAVDCPYYMKTKTCKFGPNCKFNHPVAVENNNCIVTAKEACHEEHDLECKYYLKAGGCKYGSACRYKHLKTPNNEKPPEAPVPPILDNFLGLPIRPGEKDCEHYMRHGSCKFGANCRFNHPDPTNVAGNDPQVSQNTEYPLRPSQPSVESWSTNTLIAPMNSYPVTSSHVDSTARVGWDGIQFMCPTVGPEANQEALSYSFSGMNLDGCQQPRMQITEFPERPGQPECSFFMKTGFCKFKSSCKFHHPRGRNRSMSSCTLSERGLPLRHGLRVCKHYSQYGICKYGPSCIFDHPDTLPTSNGPSNLPS